jgi:general stress protein YciG
MISTRSLIGAQPVGSGEGTVNKEMIMATSKDGNKQSGSRGGQGSGTSNRGFASMDPERQREIASEGGKAAHEKGTAHEFTSEEARRAGSMSHGNRQSDQSRSRSGSESSKQSGNKQSDRSEDDSDKKGGSKSR